MARTSRKEVLLQTALELFSSNGLEGVSLREINAKAKMSSSALHYHFGCKDELVKALLGEVAPKYFKVRRKMIMRLCNDVDAITIYSIIDALVKPISNRVKESPEEAQIELKFLLDLYSHASEKYVYAFEWSWRSFYPLLQHILSDISEQELKLRWLFASELTLRSIVNRHYLVKCSKGSYDESKEFDAFIETMIHFIAAGVMQGIAAKH